MKRNQVTRKVGSMVILRETAENPSDEEWDETLAILDAHKDELEQIKVLVRTDGGGPSPTQRKKLQQVLRGKVIRVAVVSESVRVRFIVSSVALVTSKISSFRIHETPQAYDYLGLTSRERILVDETLDELSRLVR
jgi:hypothetical protein